PNVRGMRWLKAIYNPAQWQRLGYKVNNNDWRAESPIYSCVLYFSILQSAFSLLHTFPVGLGYDRLSAFPLFGFVQSPCPSVVETGRAPSPP
ncbi:MAG: hypothetical protein LBT78_04425, partial [Tannerella sp.]|nr:hypothetical protein [Tannerella sp.]